MEILKVLWWALIAGAGVLIAIWLVWPPAEILEDDEDV